MSIGLYLSGRRANAGHCLRLDTVTGKVHPFPADPQVSSIALWGGSNGLVLEHDSFVFVYGYFRDVVAMGFVLLSVGWTGFVVPDKAWLLFDRPGGGWATVSLADFKRQLDGGDNGK